MLKRYECQYHRGAILIRSEENVTRQDAVQLIRAEPKGEKETKCSRGDAELKDTRFSSSLDLSLQKETEFLAVFGCCSYWATSIRVIARRESVKDCTGGKFSYFCSFCKTSSQLGAENGRNPEQPVSVSVIANCKANAAVYLNSTK